MSEESTPKQPTTDAWDAKVVTIPGVQMSVSLGKDVILRIPDEEQSYRGKVVGYEPYDYVIIKVRMPSKTRKALSNGGQVILKYIHKGTVYGFKSHVHNVITSPTSLIFIEYPAVIEKVELRRENRLEVNLEGALHVNEGEHECLVVNISTTGCKISARMTSKSSIAATQVDDTLIVVVNFGAEGTLKLPIAIRNIKQEKGFLIMGAMFLDLNTKESDIIEKYLQRVKRLTG